MDKCLDNFAYRVNSGQTAFLLTGMLTSMIALLTVSYQSVKAALANPVDSLRYE
jgi:putative ABC transport system permease protein